MKDKRHQNLLVYDRIVEEEYLAAQAEGIWMGALTLGCCLAECRLLMRAISSISRIQRSPKYAGTTIEQMCSSKGWGLLKLSRLALDMGWLDVKHVDRVVVDALIGGLQSIEPNVERGKLESAVPVLILHVARKQRNAIRAGKIAAHEDRLLRESFLQDAEGNCAVVNLVLACLRESQNEGAAA